MKPLNKTLLLFMLPISILVADSSISTTQLDFSSLVNDFMEEGNVLKKTINLSGKQRMLTQLMAKLALQVDVNIKKDESLKRLKKISDLYDNMLKAFKEGNSDLGIKKTTNAKVIKQITLVEKAWNPFYKRVNQLIEGKNSKEALTYIVEKNEDLLKVSNDLVKVFESTNSSENYLEKARLHIVNVAGRQRMLTQKMTKEKLLILKGEKKYDSKLKETVALFDDALTTLIKGDSKKMISKPSNEKIITQLKVVSKLWSELKPLYEKKKNSVKELATIVTKNPLLLKEMNSMVKLAEKELEY